MQVKVYVLKDEEGVLRPQAFCFVDSSYVQDSIEEYKSKNKKMFQNGCEIVLCELQEVTNTQPICVK